MIGSGIKWWHFHNTTNKSIVIGSGIKWWHFDNTTNNSDITNTVYVQLRYSFRSDPLVMTLTCSFEIFVAAINFNSLNHGHLKNRHDLETLEKVFK